MQQVREDCIPFVYRSTSEKITRDPQEHSIGGVGVRRFITAYHRDCESQSAWPPVWSGLTGIMSIIVLFYYMLFSINFCSLYFMVCFVHDVAGFSHCLLSRAKSCANVHEQPDFGVTDPHKYHKYHKSSYSGWLRNPAPVHGSHPTIHRLQPSFWWCRISQSTVVTLW